MKKNINHFTGEFDLGKQIDTETQSPINSDKKMSHLDSLMVDIFTFFLV